MKAELCCRGPRIGRDTNISSVRKIFHVFGFGFASSSIVSGLDNNGGKVDWSSDFLKYVQETSSGDCVKSELDLYLEELVLFNQSNISKFDILGYWKNIGVKYPTLQRIVKNFLAIPISTVASESAFSIGGGKFLTPHHSKLNEDTVEALMH